MRDLAARFTALADPTRLEMLALIQRHGELCVCDLVAALEITQSKASRHLRTLWHAGLLEDRRAGLWVYYRVPPALDPERREILLVLGKVFARRDLRALEARLARWLKDKGRAGGVCKVPVVARKRSA